MVGLVASVLVIDIALFGSTDATKVPSFVVIVGFLAVVLTLGLAWYGFFNVLSLYGLRIRRKVRFAAYMSALSGALIALQSIGELSKRDIVVLLPMVVLGYLYSIYARSDRSNFET
jgi:hypothetical protein